MAQTPTCLLDGGPYKPPLGDCAIYSETTVHSLELTWKWTTPLFVEDIWSFQKPYHGSHQDVANRAYIETIMEVEQFGWRIILLYKGVLVSFHALIIPTNRG